MSYEEAKKHAEKTMEYIKKAAKEYSKVKCVDAKMYCHACPIDEISPVSFSEVQYALCEILELIAKEEGY